VEAIAGDLREQFQDRSASWYWRQVGAAIALGAMQHLRRHWMQALWAIWLGGAAMGLASVMFRTLAYWLLPAILPAPISPVSLPVLFWTVGLPAFIAGWIVGRLNRPYGVPFAIALAIMVLNIQVIPKLAFLTRNALQHERFAPYLWGYVAHVPVFVALVLTAILLGAVIGQSAGGLFEKGTRS
jgi:hypothetical protein